jgi:hypothetical protein
MSRRRRSDSGSANTGKNDNRGKDANNELHNENLLEIGQLGINPLLSKC